MRLALFVGAGGLTALLGVACATQDRRADTSWSGSIDTLPSGQIVVANLEQPSWKPADQWQVREELRIGSASGAGPSVFGRIESFVADPGGRIWVLDGLAQEVRVFSSSGDYMRTVGRLGSGPGEFTRAVRIDLSPDGHIWVMDPNNNRLSVFDTAGVYLEGKRAAGGFLVFPWPGGFDNEGRYYAPAYKPGRLVRFDASFQPIDTLDVPEDPVKREQFEQRAADGRVVAVANIPFSGRLIWHLSRTGTIWALITDQYRLFELGSDGDTIRTIVRAFTPLPVSEADRDQAREDLKWFTDHGGQVDGTKVPRTKPGARSLFLDDQARIWVEPETDGDERGRALDVFDAEGRYLGTVRLPFSLDESPRPIIQHGTLYGVTRDNLDVQHVVRARIVETP